MPLSQRFDPPLVPLQPFNSQPQREARTKRKHVRFCPCTTDIIEALYRSTFRFPPRNSSRTGHHRRSILKNPLDVDMSGYLRIAGSAFARALGALGAWCTGVTSSNPNIRSDMYKQLVAQIRGTSPHLRRAGESVLQANVHGMWMQLVDDFTIHREEYSQNDIALYYSMFLLELTIATRMLRSSLVSSFRITNFWKSWKYWTYRLLF